MTPTVYIVLYGSGAGSPEWMVYRTRQQADAALAAAGDAAVGIAKLVYDAGVTCRAAALRHQRRAR